MLLKYFGKKANLELFSIMCLMSTLAAAGPAFGGWAKDTFSSFEGLFLIYEGAVTTAMFLATKSSAARHAERRAGHSGPAARRMTGRPDHRRPRHRQPR